MTTRTEQPIGLIDISAVEYEARAARAAAMREAAVALPAFFARFIERLRAKPQALPQALPQAQSQTKAFA